MQIYAMDHIVLEVADVEKSVTFYRALGLLPERLDEYRRGEVKFPSLRVSSDTLIDVFPPRMHGQPKAWGHNLNHFALVSALPLAAVLDGLQQRSIAVEEQAEGNFGAHGLAASVYVRDPDGNRVEIRTYKEG